VQARDQGQHTQQQDRDAQHAVGRHPSGGFDTEADSRQKRQR
jgi:hypothetical protein